MRPGQAYALPEENRTVWVGHSCPTIMVQGRNFVPIELGPSVNVYKSGVSRRYYP
jgi:hypothetical protein